jgi:hypothetical protein
MSSNQTKFYGFFVDTSQSPPKSYFQQINEANKDTPVDDGGCWFYVNEDFMVKHLQILEDPKCVNMWVLVEIAGDETTIFPDPIMNSVINVVVMGDEIPKEDLPKIANVFREFESTHACLVVSFLRFKEAFSLRQLH